MNIGAPWPDLKEAERRVHAMQTKLHQWAAADPGRRFDDLHNLLYDPAFLVVAWNVVKTNKGARSTGVDGIAPRSIVAEGEFLAELREDLKAAGSPRRGCGRRRYRRRRASSGASASRPPQIASCSPR